MSYDLMVFDPELAPKDRADFMAWFKQQTAWSEPHGYNDPTITTTRLSAWYADIMRDYPNMNGPDVEDGDDIDNPKMTDYSIGTAVIYAAFAWSEAEGAYGAVRRLAEKHKVGFFDVSGEGEIWLPPENDALKKGFLSKPLGK